MTMNRLITALALSTLFAAAPAFAKGRTHNKPVAGDTKPAEAKPAAEGGSEAKPAEGAKPAKKPAKKSKKEAAPAPAEGTTPAK
jgi:hypothetical protein